MTAVYHTPFSASEMITSLAVNSRLGQLDSAQYRLIYGLIDWPQRLAAPAAPPAGSWRLYFRGGGLYRLNSAGEETNVSAVSNYACITDEKAQNTPGGDFTNGAWRTRTLNTVRSDVSAITSLAANQITLQAGNYRILASAPGYYVGGHQAVLYDTTGAAILIRGTTAIDPNGNNTRSIISGAFTLTIASALEIQHRCVTTRNTDGLGNESNLTTEVYTIVEIWKV